MEGTPVHQTCATVKCTLPDLADVYYTYICTLVPGVTTSKKVSETWAAQRKFTKIQR